MNINLNDTKNRHLLQPVDIWVERTVKLLTKDQGMSKDRVANWIVDNSKQPELVNMGIWYFCSKITTSEHRLNRVLKDLNDLSSAKSLVDEHAMWIKNTCQNCQNFA